MIRGMIVLALVVAASACGSYSTYRTTRVAAPGRTEWLFAAQVSGAGTGVQNQNAPLPEIAIGARRTIYERYELQVTGTMLPIKQLATGSLELAGKVRLLESGRWSLAAGVATGYRLARSSGAVVEGVFASAPVIGAVELGRHQLVLSVDGGYQRWYSSGARPVNVPFVGQRLGFLWQIGENWALLPEVGTAWTPARNAMNDHSRLFHVGIAALWTR